MTAAAPARWELLSGLSEQHRAAILERTRERRYGPKLVIFHEGDEGESLHFIVSGHVAIRAVTGQGDAAILAILGPGQAMGEMALLRRSSLRTASATALEPVVTRTLHRSDFFRLCDEEPSVERLLVGVLAARVDRLSRHLMDALFEPVDKRVARRLLEAARLYSGAGDGLVLPLTQQDIASLAGTTRPTANTVLRQLQDSGILTLGRGWVTLDDLRRLSERAR